MGRGGNVRHYEDSPELMDLGLTSYLPDTGFENQNPMSKFANQPKGHMWDEAQNTRRRRGDFMKEPLRRKPIAFVKSLEVFDPSRIITDRLNGLNKKDHENLSEGIELLNMASPAAEAATPDDNVNTLSNTPLREASSDEHSESAKEHDDEPESEPEPHLSEDDKAENERISVEQDSTVLDQPAGSVKTEDTSFVIDEEGDMDVVDRHNVERANTREVVYEGELERAKKEASKQTPVAAAAEVEYPPAHLEHEPSLTIGKVTLQTTTDSLGNTTTKLPKNHNRAYPQSFNDLDRDIEYEISDDTDEEAAFQDYMELVMGTRDDYQYEDNDDDDDLDAYLDDGDYDEDGLGDAVAFAQNNQRSFSDFDIPPTRTLKAKGKNKKLKLDFEDALDAELRESLMEQYQYQRQSRRDKKIQKKENKRMEALAQNDLGVKYENSLHVQDIKNELELFLHDVSSDKITFPPLDAHGNKTIRKMAHKFNMKSARCDNGLLKYTVVVKTRRTFNYLPDYDGIGQILRQRPFFPRADRGSYGSATFNREKQPNKANVKEGDIIGAEAPEIDHSNIGRQLLEKLGWVKGEGLGAQGNKGISVPLTVTVKKSKTGLK